MRLPSPEKIDLLIELVKTDFKLRYNHTMLGFVWVVLKPLLIFSTIYLVFSFVFKNEPNFGLNLLLGIFIFGFFSEGISRGLSALSDKSHMILKISFSRQLLVLVPIINALINFLICFLIFLVFWFISPVKVGFAALAFPIIILELAVLMVGISFFTSLITVRFRDLSSIVEVFMNMLFYATPIMYPVTVFPQSIVAVLLKNPLAVAIEESRNVLVRGGNFRLAPIVYLGFIAVFVFWLGLRYFKKHSSGVAEHF
ncbi:MAG: ABC transporter permease [bacterium]